MFQVLMIILFILLIPGNDVVNKLVLSVGEIKQMLESGLTFNRVKDITNFF